MKVRNILPISLVVLTFACHPNANEKPAQAIQLNSGPSYSNGSRTEEKQLLPGLTGRSFEAEPVSIELINWDTTGKSPNDILVALRNRGDKPVSFVRLWLNPPPQGQYEGTIFIEFGDREPVPTLNGAIAIAHDQTTTLRITSRDLTRARFKKPQDASQSNGASDAPHLWIAEVRFVDGSVWEFDKH